MEFDTLKNKYELKELELNSLLEITQAINNNLPEESLYKIFHFTLRANLNIRKMALYVFDDHWSCKVNFGTRNDFFQTDLEERFLDMNLIGAIPRLQNSPYNEFDRLIPIHHKDQKLAFVFIGGLTNGQFGSEININMIQALSNIILVAIENKKLIQRELKQEALRKELEIARNVQQFLFPKNLPKSLRLDMEAFYLPHHTIGGDYYDYIKITEEKFLICIADVSGKGMPAAIIMSNFQASLNTLIRKTTDLKEIIEELNFQIIKNANGEHFITFFVGIYDYTEQRLEYVNAGHNPPILISNGELFLLEKGSTILGSFYPIPFIDVGEVENLSSFFFFSYTDGITETFNELNEPFGFERLQDFIFANYQNKLKDLLKNLLDELVEFKGAKDYDDDITILTCTASGN
jgi:sigma-B regulation protein RsbU (phosphoserine phosphatase)